DEHPGARVQERGGEGQREGGRDGGRRDAALQGGRDGGLLHGVHGILLIGCLLRLGQSRRGPNPASGPSVVHSCVYQSDFPACSGLRLTASLIPSCEVCACWSAASAAFAAPSDAAMKASDPSAAARMIWASSRISPMVACATSIAAIASPIFAVLVAICFASFARSES